MKKVIFVTLWRAVGAGIFLFVDKDQPFLACYDHETGKFWPLCACRMPENTRQSIMDAVQEELHRGNITRTIVWCSCGLGCIEFSGLDEFPPLKQAPFKYGTADGFSFATLYALQEEAERLVADGTIAGVPQQT